MRGFVAVGDKLFDSMKLLGGVIFLAARRIKYKHNNLRRLKPMAGTKAGGKAAAATNKAKYGADFYAKIGAQGGKKGHTGGFFADRDLARIAGAKGGRISRRTKKVA
jgi:general stress protein YciG